MKPLLKVFLVLAAFFTATLVVIKLTGVLTVEQIENWLIQAKALSPFYVGSVVVLLLFADLFIAVPTLTVTVFAGYFLGHLYGTVAALIGITSAGVCGYILSRYYGDSILRYVVKDNEKREDAIRTFQRHGFVMILLSRALPMLPEATACLSGMTRMPFIKFLAAWLISGVPYVAIAAYAGSISTVENPKPGIFIAIGLFVFMWLAWFLYYRRHQRRS